MKKILAASTCLLTVGTVFAMTISLPLKQMVQESDLIAVVEIQKSPMQQKIESLDSTNRIVFLQTLSADEKQQLLTSRAGQILSKQEVLAVFESFAPQELELFYFRPKSRPPEGKKYLDKAVAKVITPIKGAITEQSFTLEFDRGLVIPDVDYSSGEICIVFAKKMDNGNYETYTNTGKFSVNDGMVKYWPHTKLRARTCLSPSPFSLEAATPPWDKIPRLMKRPNDSLIGKSHYMSRYIPLPLNSILNEIMEAIMEVQDESTALNGGPSQH